MKSLITITLLSLAQFCFAQTGASKVSLSDALVAYGNKYQTECKKAILANDMERVDFLFDSISQQYLKGKYFDDFTINKLSGREIKISDYEKPVVLISVATWYMFTEGEIKAMNALAKKYRKEIDFVVLYWGSKREARKASRDFKSCINVTYFDEANNQGSYIVGKIKHFFGFPTFFYLNSDKSIYSMSRGGVKKPFYAEQDLVYNNNINTHFVFIKGLLINAGLEVEAFATK